LLRKIMPWFLLIFWQLGPTAWSTSIINDNTNKEEIGFTNKEKE
jgi:hypothetical protein